MDAESAQKNNYNPLAIVAITIFIYFVAQIIAAIIFSVAAIVHQTTALSTLFEVKKLTIK